MTEFLSPSMRECPGTVEKTAGERMEKTVRLEIALRNARLFAVNVE